MAKYYALVAGLPQISADSPRPPLSTREFCQELDQVLTKQDRALLRLLQREGEHKELLDWISSEELTLPVLSEEVDYSYGASSEEEASLGEVAPKLRQLRQLAKAAYQGKHFRYRASDLLPVYQARFVHDLFYRPRPAEGQEEAPEVRFTELAKDRLALEDLLVAYYYDEATHSKSAFVREWAQLNKNLRNILVVFTCRRLGWNPSHYIVGTGAIEEQLRTSSAKDFGLSEALPYLPEILRIAEERDIARRERLIDLVKWRWMDDWTFVRIFEIDNVLCYYLRLQILERWSKLDPAQGEATFRGIVQGLKGESAQVLQEFKRSHGRH